MGGGGSGVGDGVSGTAVLVLEPLPGTSIGDLATHFQVSCADTEGESGSAEMTR